MGNDRTKVAMKVGAWLLMSGSPETAHSGGSDTEPPAVMVAPLLAFVLAAAVRSILLLRPR